MYGKNKILLIISGVMFLFLVSIVVILTLNFRTFAQDAELEKAKTVALILESGLTAHMASGTMTQRTVFLDNAKEASGALDVWIFRTDKVVELYGKGFKNEILRDATDKNMVKTKKIQEIIDESLDNPTLRVTIPYIATSKGTPDCLGCHSNAKEGDVLGGISMVFDLESSRISTIFMILKISGITLFFIILFVYIINRFLKPYTKSLLLMRKSLEKANNGDYSSRIDLQGDKESTETFLWLNTLLEKLEETISSIEKNIALFVSDRGQKFNTPLEKAQFVIEDMTNIYKFKKTIEQDTSKEVIYHRLIKVFKEQLHVADISLYEVDVKKDTRTLIYDDTPEHFCESADTHTSERCRAYRTKSIVLSDDFDEICQACKTTKEYLCINYPIDENITLVLNIKPNNKEELQENKKAIGYIRNYFESAKPVLQSKILTDILEKSNMIDGLTSLLNRKYLDKFMDSKIQSFNEYAVAMIDIDYFKKVNDTFGHDAGDKVLQGLSDIFRNSIGEDDIAFRFGGEEFIIFMPHVDKAYETIKKIKDNFENTTFELNGKSLNKTLSAGIAYCKSDGVSPWQVIKYADVAMYEAKNSGRNRIISYKDVEEGTTNLKKDGEY